MGISPEDLAGIVGRRRGNQSQHKQRDPEMDPTEAREPAGSVRTLGELGKNRQQ